MAVLSFAFAQYLFTSISSAAALLSAREKDDTNTSFSFSSRTSLWYSERLFYFITTKNNCLFQIHEFYAPVNFDKAIWLL